MDKEKESKEQKGAPKGVEKEKDKGLEKGRMADEKRIEISSEIKKSESELNYEGEKFDNPEGFYRHIIKSAFTYYFGDVDVQSQLDKAMECVRWLRQQTGITMIFEVEPANKNRSEIFYLLKEILDDVSRISDQIGRPIVTQHTKDVGEYDINKQSKENVNEEIGHAMIANGQNNKERPEENSSLEEERQIIRKMILAKIQEAEEAGIPLEIVIEALKQQLPEEYQGIIEEINIREKKNQHMRRHPDVPDVLTGGIEEIAIRSLILIRSHAGDYRFALDLVTGPVAEALSKMEPYITVEQSVDLILNILVNEPVYAGGKPYCTKELISVVNYFKSKIDQEGNSVGLLKTRAMLYMWLMSVNKNTDNESCMRCGLAVGMDAMDKGVSLLRSEESGELASVMRKITNNIVGQIDDLPEYSGKREEEGLLKRMNKVHAFGVMCAIKADSGDGGQYKELFKEMGMEIGQFETNERLYSYVVSIAYMNNMLKAWRYFDDEIFHEIKNEWSARGRTAVLAFLGGVLRSVYNDPSDYDEIPSALFNLGVDIRLASKIKDEGVLTRILSNALGLWWALAKSNNDEQAIEEYHGGDCAVNLLGASTEYYKGKEKSDLLERIGNAMLTKVGVDTIDGFRMSRSYKELFGKDPEQVPWDRKTVSKMVASYIEEVVKNEKVPVEEQQKQDVEGILVANYANYAAVILAYSLKREIGKKNFKGMMEEWRNVLSTMVKKVESGDYKGIMRTQVQQIFDDANIYCEPENEARWDSVAQVAKDRETIKAILGA